MMKQQINFRWRCQPFQNTKQAIVLNYIQNPPSSLGETKNNLICTALNNYYYPLAIKGKTNSQKLQQIALESIFALINQINKICQECDVEKSQIRHLLVPYFESADLIAIASQPPLEPVPLPPVSVEPKSSVESQHNHISFGNLIFTGES